MNERLVRTTGVYIFEYANPSGDPLLANIPAKRFRLRR